MDAAVTGWKPEGVAKDGFIHLINSGATTMDGTGKQKKDGKPAMKPYWEITAKEAGDCLDATSWRPADLGYFRGGGYSSDFLTEGGMPITMTRLNLVKGIGPVLQIAEGVTATLPDHVHDKLDKRTSEAAIMDAAPSRRDARARLAAQFAVVNCSGMDAAATSAPTASPWLPCSASPSACTTWKVTRSSAPATGTPSAWTGRGATIGRARRWGRCMENGKQ